MIMVLITLENKKVRCCRELHLLSRDTCFSFVPSAFPPRLHRFSASNDPHEQLSVFCPSTTFEHHATPRSVAAGFAVPHSADARVVVQDSYGAKGIEDSQDRASRRFVGLLPPE